MQEGITKFVCIESPYKGKNEEETLRNMRYARACVRDCVLNKDISVASHLYYTQPGILDDNIQGERKKGMEAGWKMFELLGDVNNLPQIPFEGVSRAYIDLGISSGMEKGLEIARKYGLKIEQKSLGENWEREFLEHEKNHSQCKLWGIYNF